MCDFCWTPGRTDVMELANGDPHKQINISNKQSVVLYFCKCSCIITFSSHTHCYPFFGPWFILQSSDWHCCFSDLGKQPSLSPTPDLLKSLNELEMLAVVQWSGTQLTVSMIKICARRRWRL